MLSRVLPVIYFCSSCRAAQISVFWWRNTPRCWEVGRAQPECLLHPPKDVVCQSTDFSFNLKLPNSKKTKQKQTNSCKKALSRKAKKLCSIRALMNSSSSIHFLYQSFFFFWAAGELVSISSLRCARGWVHPGQVHHSDTWRQTTTHSLAHT